MYTCIRLTANVNRMLYKQWY